MLLLLGLSLFLLVSIPAAPIFDIRMDLHLVFFFIVDTCRRPQVSQQVLWSGHMKQDLTFLLLLLLLLRCACKLKNRPNVDLMDAQGVVI